MKIGRCLVLSLSIIGFASIGCADPVRPVDVYRASIGQITHEALADASGVAVTPVSAKPGDNVTVIVVATPGYKLVPGSLEYKPSSGGVAVAIGGSSFVMPACDVEVSAAFTWAEYSLAEAGPSGGYVFYENPNSATDGWKYLECAPADTEWSGTQWGKLGTLVGTGTAVSSGAGNTALILAVLNAAPAETGKAAQYCAALASGGFDDWFLPSSGELDMACWALQGTRWDGSKVTANPAVTTPVGGFSGSGDRLYWSSSEIDANSALVHNFGSTFMNYGRWYYEGAGTPLTKDAAVRVRAVRRF